MIYEGEGCGPCLREEAILSLNLEVLLVDYRLRGYDLKDLV